VAICVHGEESSIKEGNVYQLHVYQCFTKQWVSFSCNVQYRYCNTYLLTLSLSLPVSSLIFQFLCPEDWSDLSLSSAHIPVLREVSLLNCTLQHIAVSIHQILSEPPSVECCNTQYFFTYNKKVFKNL